MIADGSEEALDLILLATAYDSTVPCRDRSHLDWVGNHLKTYLTACNARHDNLFTLGFIETAAGVYDDFDHLAHLIACAVLGQDRDPHKFRGFKNLVRSLQPDLSGGVSYVDSARYGTWAALRCLPDPSSAAAALPMWGVDARRRAAHGTSPGDPIRSHEMSHDQ